MSGKDQTVIVRKIAAQRISLSTFPNSDEKTWLHFDGPIGLSKSERPPKYERRDDSNPYLKMIDHLLKVKMNDTGVWQNADRA